MKYVVTGSTGLVGRNLTEYILDNKADTDEVLATGRNPDILKILKGLGANTKPLDLTADISEFDTLNDYGGSDAVWFHCAAAVTGASETSFREINIGGTKKLIQKAEELNIHKFILVSSISVYGLHSKDNSGFSEDQEYNPGGTYGESKLEQETLMKSSSIKWLIFRPPYIGGPNDKNVLVEFSKRIKSGKMPLFSKSGYLGYVDARDLASMMFKGSQSELSNEAYNVQGTACTLDEFVETLGRNLDLEPPYGKKYPYRLVMTLGYINDFIAKLRGKSGARSISAYRIRALTSNRILDTTKISKDLEFKPNYTIDQSIKDWLKTTST
ncbi:MAG: NAD(P)-dependent oxidoreductase [Candidatus Heimdallarchaeota archaeon]|nr:NAD(P)-dependent oxidoreductase [Candidatus Heimdallarchaeota archaeon]